jgi:hypothetical protein
MTEFLVVVGVMPMKLASVFVSMSNAGIRCWRARRRAKKKASVPRTTTIKAPKPPAMAAMVVVLEDEEAEETTKGEEEGVSELKAAVAVSLPQIMSQESATKFKALTWHQKCRRMKMKRVWVSLGWRRIENRLM